MTLLTSCWFIIESIVIPDGLLLKWFYLSFYIHPSLLILCQIILWLKLLIIWLLTPLNYICFVSICVFRYLRKYAVCFFLSFKKLTNAEVEEEDVFFEILQHGYENHQIANSYSCSSVVPWRCGLKINELQIYGYGEDNNLHADEDRSVDDQFSSSLCGSEKSSISSEVDYSNEYVPLSVYSSNSPPGDFDTNVYVPSVCSFNHPFTEKVVADEPSSDPLDPFYNKYTERMRWFDLLNSDRTCGIGSILNKKLGSESSIEFITEPVDFSFPYMSWSKMARKKLLRSLENDFETVYVGQTCLSWEALHHQYKKVEALASSSSQNGVFYNNVAGEFQKFQVLLVRFMEDERCQGKRFWNYSKGRFSFKSLIQVPEVTGYFKEENEGMKGEAMNNVKEVLKSIEKCIKAFWVFVKTDKKNWWKLRSSLWTNTPVEDPKDLELLANLTKKLQKEILLKDLQGKKRCWLKRRTVNHNGEYSETKEILFTTIDMTLVARVLQMSLISSSQLKWCQEKLDNIQFREEKVTRACACLLFPSS